MSLQRKELTMRETPKTLLEETSELLDALMPVVERSIDALQQNPNPLLQHLIQQEIESQEGLLQRIKEMKRSLQEHLNPPERSVEGDLPLTEITGGPSPIGTLPAGAVRRQSYPLAVTMPDGKRICHSEAIDTLIEVIGELGIEKVRTHGIMSHGIPLVAINDYDGKKQTPVGRYYVAGNSSTDTKVEQIKAVACCLDVKLIPVQLNLIKNLSET